MTGKMINKMFDFRQMATVNQAVGVAEELVSGYYKLSDSRMKGLNYDIRTRSKLVPHEIIDSHFAQIVRYRAQKKNSVLETDATDFYLICLQDHSILDSVDRFRQLKLYPFMIYIVCHELVHVVRFRRFLQHFHVSAEARRLEEIRVHHATREIISKSNIDDIAPVFEFYGKWQEAFEQMDEIAANKDDSL